MEPTPGGRQKPPSLRQRLQTLPKAHLHIHLEGAMRRSTLEELCRRYDLPLPPDTRGRRIEGFVAFLKVFWAACDVIRTKEDLARLILEVAEDAKAEGVWWLEPAFDAARYSELRPEKAIDGEPPRLFKSQEEGWHFALQAAEQASRATGVGIGFISAADRLMPVEQALERARVTRDLVRAGEHVIEQHLPLGENGAPVVVRHPGIVAFGLHGKEEGNPPEPFAEAFKIALDDTGLLSVPHAGEIAPHPGGGPASVRGALAALRPDRIEHGVLAVEDQTLLDDLARRGICLDLCPTSNLNLGVFPAAAAWPLQQILEAGIPCTINSDDPLLFGADLVDELVFCREQLGITEATLGALARQSFAASAAPEALKTHGRAAIDRVFARS
jgi:adenosine deaminase